MRAPLYSEQHDEILGAAAMDSPYDLYARLRREAPIARIGDSGVHAVSTWALIDEALGREKDFSANLTGVLFRGPDGAPSTFDLSGAGAIDVIATADEPHHGIHRAASQPRLDARRIAKMEDRVRRWAREAVAPWVAAGGGDCIPIAEVVPALAVAYLLGLPEQDVSRFRVWAMMGGDLLAGEADGARLGFLATESGKMGAYLGEHFDAAYADPDNDPDAPLLHALALAVQAGKIDRQEAIGIAIVMFGAGGESTAALIGSTLRGIADDPNLARRLRSEPELIPRYIEEIVRLESPFNFHYRAVRRRCNLGGFDLEPGDRLMLLWASANRDAAIHEDPDTLRLDRKHPKKHMGFGRGMHFCIGAPLARLEARAVLEEVLRTTSELEPAKANDNASDSDSGEAPGTYARYAPSIFIRRLESLCIKATPAMRA